MRALDAKLLRGLWRMRGQGLATALLVACGVAVFVMSQGTLLSLLDTRAAYYERYRFADVFAGLTRAPDALAERIAAIPGVKWAEARIVRTVTLDLADVREPATGRLVSIPAEGRPLLNDLVLVAGRWIRRGHPDEVLVSRAFAEANGLRPGDGFAAILDGHRRTLRVVGIALSPEFVYALAPGSLVPDYRRFGVIWMGREALAAAFDLDGAFNDVTLALQRGAAPQAVIDALDDLLAPYGGHGAFGRERQQSHAFLAGEMDQLRTMGRVIPPVFLAVAAFLLHVLATRLVQLDREQIGLLKALGYTDLEVGWHYTRMILAMVLAGFLAGAGGGVWLGRLMTGLYTQFYSFPFLYFSFDPATFLPAAAISLAAGVGGAAAAVRGALLLSPAAAMQPAPPAIYRQGVLERLGGLGRLSQPSRMILRHVVRWPLRSAVTGAGIAMSVGLMVSTLFFFDATDAIIETVFHASRRADVTIGFADAQGPAIVGEVARLPGVMVAEPARMVGVRLVHGHRSWRTTIQSVAGGGGLVRALDADLRPVVAPPFGLLLGDHLAERLGAGPGDRIVVAVLEGPRPVDEVPVVGVVRDDVGTFAYMSRPALDRLAGEGPRVGAVDVRLDTAAEDAFYRRLKEMPAVAAVTLWRTSLQGFRDTIAESMAIVVSFYVAFGSAIAFGVAYNAARISLSERGRELASLRVLGFTRFEVSYILLGELAVVALPALPLGCLVGWGLASVMAGAMSSDLFRIPLVIEPATYGLAVAGATAATVLSGLLVRRRLDRLDLIEVLKTRE